MRRSLILGTLAILIAGSIVHAETTTVILSTTSSTQPTQLATAATTTTLTPNTILEPAEIPAPAPSPAPMRVSIPAIGLNSPIKNMGVLSNGDLDVPAGNTNNVGWYAGGTTPGNTGSAVLDAHVFAAFSKLNQLKPGDDIYIQTAAGTTLHFVVQASETYPLAQVPLQTLYNRDDAVRLNLITCAGKLMPDHSTYDHRLVVYAVLIQN